MNIFIQILLITLLIFLKAFAVFFGLYVAYLVIKRISPSDAKEIKTVASRYTNP